ncbi:helix-turn-helix transcriptional regulator [Paenibacillus larvae]
MEYTEMLKLHISKSGMSANKIVEKLKQKGIHIDRSYVSKLKNGRVDYPASDEINIALAEILGIDPVKFRLAALKEKIPPDLYELIQNVG